MFYVVFDRKHQRLLSVSTRHESTVFETLEEATEAAKAAVMERPGAIMHICVTAGRVAEVNGVAVATNP